MWCDYDLSDHIRQIEDLLYKQNSCDICSACRFASAALMLLTSCLNKRYPNTFDYISLEDVAND